MSLLHNDAPLTQSFILNKLNSSTDDTLPRQSFFCASKDSIRNNKLTLTLSQPCSLLKHGAVISELCNVTHLTGNAEYSV